MVRYFGAPRISLRHPCTMLVLMEVSCSIFIAFAVQRNRSAASFAGLYFLSRTYFLGCRLICTLSMSLRIFVAAQLPRRDEVGWKGEHAYVLLIVVLRSSMRCGIGLCEVPAFSDSNHQCPSTSKLTGANFARKIF